MSPEQEARLRAALAAAPVERPSGGPGTIYGLKGTGLPLQWVALDPWPDAPEHPEEDASVALVPADELRLVGSRDVYVARGATGPLTVRTGLLVRVPSSLPHVTLGALDPVDLARVRARLEPDGASADPEAHLTEGDPEYLDWVARVQRVAATVSLPGPASNPRMNDDDRRTTQSRGAAAAGQRAGREPHAPRGTKQRSPEARARRLRWMAVGAVAALAAVILVVREPGPGRLVPMGGPADVEPERPRPTLMRRVPGGVEVIAPDEIVPGDRLVVEVKEAEVFVLRAGDASLLPRVGERWSWEVAEGATLLVLPASAGVTLSTLFAPDWQARLGATGVPYVAVPVPSAP